MRPVKLPRVVMRSPLCIFFSNLGLGGVQTKIIDIVNYVGRRYPQVDVHIVVRKERSFDLKGKITNPRVSIHNFELAVGNIKSPFLFTVYVLFIVWRLRPSASLVFLSPFALPVLLAKKLFFWRHHTVVVNEDNYTSGIINTYTYPRLNSWGIRLLYPQADAIIVPTHAVQHDLTFTYNIPVRQVAVIPNWTSINPKHIPQQKIIYDLLYIGRLSKTKRVHRIIEATWELKKQHPYIVLCITGDGEELGYLKTLVEKRNLRDNVIFHTATLNAPQTIAQAKIYVLSSQYKAEGFPVAMLEAMKIGTPVLSYVFAGARELLHDRSNALLCRSQKEFVQKAHELLIDASLKRHLVTRAKYTVSTRCSQKNIQKYLQLLHI